MNKTPLIITCIVAIVFAILPNRAQCQIDPDEDPTQFFQLNTITTAVPFLMIGPDSRSGALGDAGVALSPDANSMHWNPAKMAFIDSELDVSLCYTPWLRALVDDMNLAYLSGVDKLNRKQAVGYALRYFSLGDITFTDEQGSTLMDFQPAEFSLDVGFSQKFTDKFSGGVTGRFIHSNLTGGQVVVGAESKPGISVAADVGLFYTNKNANWFGKKGMFNWGMNFSNIGSKMSYTETAARDFIPGNLRIGTAYKMQIDDYNALTFTVDLNKLLVPTQPIYHEYNSNIIVSGFDPNIGVATGMVQSFYDAPGVVTFTDSVDLQPVGPEGSLIDVYHDPSEYTVEPGSIFREELREINIGGGLEYEFLDVFAFRAGYFYENYSKGNRQFIAMGAGLKYTVFNIDLSYIISTTQQNPLANTLRFTLSLQFSDLEEFLKED